MPFGLPLFVFSLLLDGWGDYWRQLSDADSDGMIDRRE